MLLRLYKTNKPYLIILIPITGILLWINGFINCDTNYINEIGIEMPLYKFISSYINYNCYISKIIALIIVISQGFYLSKLNKDFIFIKKRTFLHALIFLMIISSNIITQFAIPVLIANFFVLFSIDWLFSSYKKEKPNIELFNSGLFISISGLIYLNAFILIIPIFISYIILHTFKIREFLVILTGFITPIFITIGILFLNDNLLDNLNQISETIINSKYNFNMDISAYIFYAYLILLLIISFFNIMRIYASKKIHARVYMSSLFIFFFTAFISYIVFPFVGIEMLIISAVPIAYIITDNYVNIKNSIFAEISFLILLITLILAQISF
jgi:hypothetical protein